MNGRAASSEQSKLVFIGTYTGGKSRGIYVSRFNSATGELTPPELAAETKNPTFLAVHPKRPWLYAANEVGDFDGRKVGSVSAFKINEADGKLTLLNQQPSGGSGPCHLALGKKGKCVLVANYGSGSVAALPVLPGGYLDSPTAAIQHEGSSINRQRQSGPHAHFIQPDRANRFVLACDLGIDKVLVYRFLPGDTAFAPNTMPSVSVKPGSGPRHLAFAPNGRFVYLVNEMASTLTVFSYDATAGELREVQTISTLPEGFSGNSSCAEVEFHPSGKFIYVSNRGHDSLSVFSVHAETGRLTYVDTQATGGKTPRHFVFDPKGKWLLAENQDSNSIGVFSVDAPTGRLSPAGHTVQVAAPVCAVFY